MKTALILGHNSYSIPFREHYNIEDEYTDKVDLIVFTGGEDINPALYNEKPDGTSWWDDERDRDEINWFNYAKNNRIPMVGICRGLQFLNVMSGGKLIQNLSSEEHYCPKEWHNITTSDGECLGVNSLHHQGCIPSKSSIVLARSVFGNIPEAIYFPKINSLGVQWHPEMLGRSKKGYTYFQELLEKWVL